MTIIELCSCSGGMGEGFRRAGIPVTMAFDMDPDACASYEANHGHAPIRMDVRDLVRMARAGWRPGWVDLLVADPPCTPWSRAGKRLGVADERDLLHETTELIALLEPGAYLIGNVPGLNDSDQWEHVQDALAPLRKLGYCIADYANLDAANYGVPQHRIRPFWYGHRAGPCVRWPMPTHGDPDDPSVHSVLPGMPTLQPWVTCRQALAHLAPDELGRQVKVRFRDDGIGRGTNPEKPGATITTQVPRKGVHNDGAVLRKKSLSKQDRGVYTVRPGEDHSSDPDRPARTVMTDNASTVLVRTSKHPVAGDGPSPTICAGGKKGPPQTVMVTGRTASANGVPNVIAEIGGGPVNESGSLKHPPNRLDEPALAIAAKYRGQGGQVLVADVRHPMTRPDEPAFVVKTNGGRAAQAGSMAEWPWDRPSTTIARDERIPPPGHHDEDFAVMSLPNAVILSEKAATILQGFPETWRFISKTKRGRWSQLGQAMPPPLAHAVATAIREQLEATKEGAELRELEKRCV